MKQEYTNRQKIGIKFLIEGFYYKETDIKKNTNSMAIAIDKMQTFYMVYSQYFEKNLYYLRQNSQSDQNLNIVPKKQGLNKKQIQMFIKYFREQEYDQMFKSDKVEGVFSSKKQIKIFDAIYKSGECDFRDPTQRILTFQLSAGLLEKFEVVEYAVLESLFYKSNGVDLWSKSTQDLKNKFLKKFDHKDDISRKKAIQEIVKKYSQSEIELQFKRLGNPQYIVDYFIYQKRHGYPLIKTYLYENWVENPMTLIKKIVEAISKLLANEYKKLPKEFDNIFHDSDSTISYLDQKIKKYSDRKWSKTSKIKCRTNEISHFVINKYFPYHFLKGSNLIESTEHQLTAYLDESFKKNVICLNNDLQFLIFEIFSHLNLIETFGVCVSRGCPKQSKKKVFVKYPKKNRLYCSNKCAAYEGVCISREKQKHTELQKNSCYQ